MAQPILSKYIQDYLSLENTNARLLRIKKDIEINQMYRLSKSTIKSIRIGAFSTPKDALLSKFALKSKTSKVSAQKSNSVASEETRDEEFLDAVAPQTEVKKCNLDFDEIFSSKMKKKIVKTRFHKKVSNFSLRKAKKRLSLVSKKDTSCVVF
jgi:intein-encoded DNA endonuclease-like protein